MWNSIEISTRRPMGLGRRRRSETNQDESTGITDNAFCFIAEPFPLVIRCRLWWMSQDARLKIFWMFQHQTVRWVQTTAVLNSNLTVSLFLLKVHCIKAVVAVAASHNDNPEYTFNLLVPKNKKIWCFFMRDKKPVGETLFQIMLWGVMHWLVDRRRTAIKVCEKFRDCASRPQWYSKGNRYPN